jgi:hypothetical protein
MKRIKVIFGTIAALAIVALAALNLSLNSQSENLSLFSLANVEALADNDTNNNNNNNNNNNGGGNGVESCSILLYTRNAKEQYVTTTVQYNASVGLHAKIGNRTVSLSTQASVGGSVGIPDCVTSEGNCCAKSFIEKSPKYY